MNIESVKDFVKESIKTQDNEAELNIIQNLFISECASQKISLAGTLVFFFKAEIIFELDKLRIMRLFE